MKRARTRRCALCVHVRTRSARHAARVRVRVHGYCVCNEYLQCVCARGRSGTEGQLSVCAPRTTPPAPRGPAAASPLAGSPLSPPPPPSPSRWVGRRRRPVQRPLEWRCDHGRDHADHVWRGAGVQRHGEGAAAPWRVAAAVRPLQWACTTTRPSRDADAIRRPLGAHALAAAPAPWPARRDTAAPVAARQTRREPSVGPETSRSPAPRDRLHPVGRLQPGLVMCAGTACPEAPVRHRLYAAQPSQAPVQPSPAPRLHLRLRDRQIPIAKANTHHTRERQPTHRRAKADS